MRCDAYLIGPDNGKRLTLLQARNNHNNPTSSAPSAAIHASLIVLRGAYCNSSVSGSAAAVSAHSRFRDWNPASSYPERDVILPTKPNRPNITTQQGAFGTFKLSLLDSLRGLVGARLSWWEYDSHGSPASNYKVTREVTPFFEVNANNLFDKVYYKKFAPTGIGYYYGDPRNVAVTLRGTP